MNNLQKMGGIAALLEAAAYVLGMVFFIFVVDYASVVDPVEKVGLLLDNQSSMNMVTLIIYVLFGILLVVLALALHERLKSRAPAMIQTATAFGLIWAGLVMASGMIFTIGMNTVVSLYGQDPSQAATVWLAIDAVFEGLGGGVEIVGGLWILLASWAALRASELPRALNYLGVVIGTAGILSVVPAIGEIGAMLFGLGQIVWFIWIGIVMVRRDPSAAERPNAFVPRPRTTD